MKGDQCSFAKFPRHGMLVVMKGKIKGRVVALLASISITVYIVWRIGFTIHGDVNLVSLIFAIILVVFETINAIELFIYYKHIISIQEPKKPKFNVKDPPSVDVLIATLNEPVEILRETAEACVKMKYPDRKKIHIYICDDGSRSKVEKLAKSLKIGYITRKNHPNAKAGNYNNALSKTKSELIAIFDADMIPAENFLLETVPFFTGKNGDKIGFVQTPQMFYEPDMFQFNLYTEETMPNEHEYFYRVVQPSKNRSNSVIFCGTNAVVSRQSLADAGGFSTLSITEDFATGVEIQSKGYKCIAISTPLASGLPPHNLRNLIRQRVRWARGNVQAGRRLNVLFRKGLSFWQRINYFEAVTNWFFPLKQIIFLVAPVLFAVFGIVFVKCTLIDVLMFWLPMYAMTNFSIWYFSKKMRKTKWTRIYETIFTPALLLPIIMETFGMTYDNFTVTDKKRRGEDKDSPLYKFSYATPFIITLLITGFGIYRIIMGIAGGAINHYIVLFWLVLNAYYLVTALRFIFSDRRPESVATYKIKADSVSEFIEQPIETPSSQAKQSSPIRTVRGDKAKTRFGFIWRLATGVAVAGMVIAAIIFRQPILDVLMPDNRMPIPTMTRGINIGNALESPRDEDWGLDIKNEYFDIIADAGFDFVRIPVRLSEYLDDGLLEKSFMETLDDHINYAIDADLTVIIDLHHYDEFMTNPDEYIGEFLSIWDQLSEHYAEYPNKLVFELLNEPSKLLHTTKWNQYAKEALAVVRRTNPDRTIIVGSTNMYSIFDLKLLDLPKDDRLIVAFNYYLPNKFTFQGDPYHPGFEKTSGEKWGDDEDIELLEGRFAAAAKLAEEKGWAGLALNEFGVNKSVPDELRARWTKAVREQAEKYNISWAYWEFATSFGIYDTKTNEWNDEVLNALMDR